MHKYANNAATTSPATARSDHRPAATTSAKEHKWPYNKPIDGCQKRVTSRIKLSSGRGYGGFSEGKQVRVIADGRSYTVSNDSPPLDK